jgi:anti-sigma-K factor RskA
MSPARAPRNGDHETYDELAVGWALHALEPEDEALFSRHQPDCDRCARTVAETEEVMASLATELPPAEPSEALRARLRDAVEETEQVRRPALPPDQPTELPEDLLGDPRPTAPHAPGVRPRVGVPPTAGWLRTGASDTGWRRRLPVALGAAAAAVILGLGAWNVALSSDREQAQTAATQESHMIDSLLQPGQATIAPVSDIGGHSVATVVARHGQVQVVTWGLSENNRNASTYVVWGVVGGGSPVPLGTFDVVQSGMDLRTVGSEQTGLDAYSAYAISLEPGRKAPSKPTDVVAKGQVTP